VSTALATFGELGQTLREEITSRHLSQREAAIEIGVSYRTLQSWLSDTEIVPQPKHRRAILAWLNERAAA
jgi:transcriptional regulator with XRE-family HTH domain